MEEQTVHSKSGIQVGHKIGAGFGDAGIPIHEFRRLVTDPFGTTIITSDWVVVKILEGTWLTAIAKYGFGWPDDKLCYVYFLTHADECKPTGDEKRDRFIPQYFPEGGKWDGKTNKWGLRDSDIKKETYWWFKINEEIKEEPSFNVELKYLLDMNTDAHKVRKSLYDGLKRALWDPMQGTHLQAKQRLLQKLNEIETHMKNTLQREVETDNIIREFEFDKVELRKLLEIEVRKAQAKGELINSDDVEKIISSFDSWIKMFDNRKLGLDELKKVIKWEVELISFIIEAYEKAHDPKSVYEVRHVFSEKEQKEWSERVPRKVLLKVPESSS